MYNLWRKFQVLLRSWEQLRHVNKGTVAVHYATDVKDSLNCLLEMY